MPDMLTQRGPALEQRFDAAGDARRNAGHFGVAGRGCRVKADAAPFVHSVDAIEHQHVEVDIQIERVSESWTKVTAPHRACRIPY